MVACTRCGHWHTDAEDTMGKNLSCTEVRQFWARVRNEHHERYGHLPQITANDTGAWICFKCKRTLE
jgi:hypothetical protein